LSRLWPRLSAQLEEALSEMGDPHQVLKGDQFHNVILETEGAFRFEEFTIEVGASKKTAVFGLLYEHQWSKAASPGSPLEYRCVPLGVLLSRTDTPEFEEAESYAEKEADGTATGTEVFAERLFRYLRMKPGMSLDDRHLAHEFFCPPVSLMASAGAVQVTMIRISQIPPVEVKNIRLGGFREFRKTLLAILLCGHIVMDSKRLDMECANLMNKMTARLGGIDTNAPWKWEELWGKTARLLLDSFTSELIARDVLRRCKFRYCDSGPYFIPRRSWQTHCTERCKKNDANIRQYDKNRKKGHRTRRGSS
jgi:hypothetical protein